MSCILKDASWLASLCCRKRRHRSGPRMVVKAFEAVSVKRGEKAHCRTSVRSCGAGFVMVNDARVRTLRASETQRFRQERRKTSGLVLRWVPLQVKIGHIAVKVSVRCAAVS